VRPGSDPNEGHSDFSALLRYAERDGSVMRTNSLLVALGVSLGTALATGCSGSEATDGSGGSAGASESGAGGGGAGGAQSGSSNNGGGGTNSTGAGGTSTAGSAGTTGSGGTAGAGGTGDCGCVEQTVSWNHDGGFVAYRETSTLEPCRTFRHVREPLATDPPSLTCTDPIDSCDDLTRPADIQSALAHPDVAAALASSPVLFGSDTRPVDGQVFQVHVGAALIEIGHECGGTAGCTDAPAGVAALQSALLELRSDLLDRPPCSDTF
jgi:hypothetical protein